MTITWAVEYEYFNYKPMSIKRGFETYEEAWEWSMMNTEDGEVISEKTEAE